MSYEEVDELTQQYSGQLRSWTPRGVCPKMVPRSDIWTVSTHQERREGGGRATI
ncbi:hypothetical protein Dimus_003735, partial [Dionaea muscipula]